MAAKVAILLPVYCAFLIFGSMCAAVGCLTVVVDAVNGTDNATCLLPKSDTKCRSLSFVADYLTQREMVEIVIESGDSALHSLSQSLPSPSGSGRDCDREWRAESHRTCGLHRVPPPHHLWPQ